MAENKKRPPKTPTSAESTVEPEMAVLLGLLEQLRRTAEVLHELNKQVGAMYGPKPRRLSVVEGGDSDG